MNEVVIEKINGGLGRRNPSGDMISGLVASGVAVVGGVQLSTVYRLKSEKDAQALLLDDAYDSTNKVLVYEHIKEFFRANPSGDLYILIAPQSEMYANLVDKNKNFANKLLIEAEGKIKQLAVAYNPVIPVIDFSETTSAITQAQLLATDSYIKHRPVHIVLEGKGFDYSAPIVFRAFDSKNVSVMIGQSLSVANAIVENNTYSAVGTLLGTLSKCAVNENIAWVGKYNLYGGSLITAGISKVAINSISDGIKDTLNDNGAIFFRNHVGRAGIYFNDSHTATSLTDDYAYIENNRTIDKAVRAIREVLLPRLNSTVLVGSDGKLSPEVVKSYQSAGRNALENMLKQEEISAFDVFVDPEQNVLLSSELIVNFELTPTGTARKIKAVVGFVNPF